MDSFPLTTSHPFRGGLCERVAKVRCRQPAIATCLDVEFQRAARPPDHAGQLGAVVSGDDERAAELYDDANLGVDVPVPDVLLHGCVQSVPIAVTNIALADAELAPGVHWSGK